MFFNGFKKVAVNWGEVAEGAAGAGKALLSGIKSSGAGTVADAAKLKGLHHVSDAVTEAAKAKNLSSKAKIIANGIGKAAPSLAAGAAYTGVAKKVYDKTLGGKDDDGYNS